MAQSYSSSSLTPQPSENSLWLLPVLCRTFRPHLRPGLNPDPNERVGLLELVDLYFVQ